MSDRFTELTGIDSAYFLNEVLSILDLDTKSQDDDLVTTPITTTILRSCYTTEVLGTISRTDTVMVIRRAE